MNTILTPQPTPGSKLPATYMPPSVLNETMQANMALLNAADKPQPLRTIELKGNALAVRYGKDGPVVNVAFAHALTNAAEYLFEMAQGLIEGECLVLDRQARSLSVFHLQHALSLDASEFIIIHRPTGTSVSHHFTGEKQ